MGRQVICILCRRSEESTITGALSTKDNITAHQNCLLYSSGIYCQNSPQFDDLFGFSVEDVKDEVKRGRRLFCDICKQRGATAGCEVKRCKKSYHYPCAVQSGAEQAEDEVNGTYLLYCSKHSQQRAAEANGNVSTVTDHETQTNVTSENASSKVVCLVCEKKEESISLESLNSHIKLYCKKHRPSSWKNEPNGHDAVAGPSNHSGDSNSFSGFRRSKRHSSSNSKQEGTPSKQMISRRRIVDSDSDEDKSDAHMEMFAPIESDSDDSINSHPEQQNPKKPEPIRNGCDIPVASTSENHLHQCKEGDKDDDVTLIESDVESDSLLEPVSIFVGYKNGSQLLEVKAMPSSPGPEPSYDSATFWMGCNEAGCTHAIFSDFIAEMNNLSNRIQSGQASQEDYNLSLRVMEASGKLPELVAKQEEDMKRRQEELQNAVVAMKKVRSALKR